MSKFITGKELEDAVYNIIWEAKHDLLIVSPYISLGDYFEKLFEKQLKNYKLHIHIIFGKNEGQVNKSFNRKDLDFFKQFSNISISYVPNLHAKYYANDNQGVLTSINLYDYSFVNNIEFGVQYENNFLNKLSKNSDNVVWDNCKKIADENEVVFIKRPVFKFNTFSKDEFIESRVLLDRTDELYSGKTLSKSYKKVSDFEEELNYNDLYKDRPDRIQERPSRQEEKPMRDIVKPQTNKPFYEEKQNSWKSSIEPGYCIRTGEKIPFNPDRPFTYQAFQSWNQFGNENYAERFCHYSGEPSHGETSFSRPILNKNWKKAQQLAKF